MAIPGAGVTRDFPLLGRCALSFTGAANRYGDGVPLTIFLQQINETHHKGLDVGEE